MNMNAAAASRALIERYYSAFNRADWDAMLDQLDEQVAHDLNQGERQIGRARFRAFLERMARCYLEVLTDVRILVSDDGSHAAAEYIVSGQYLCIRPTPHILDLTVRQDVAGFQFIGSSASKSLLLDPGRRVSTSVR